MGEGGRVWMGCGGCSVLAGSEHGEVTVERAGGEIKGPPRGAGVAGRKALLLPYRSVSVELGS